MVLLIPITICLSTQAFAQDATPKVGNKPLVRVKPKEPIDCKLVGTVRGLTRSQRPLILSELLFPIVQRPPVTRNPVG